MSESYSLISAREHYLMQPVVDAFTDYLAEYIAGRVFDPPYLTQTYRPKAQYCFTSLEDAWEQYIQEAPNREFQNRLIHYEKPLKEVIDKRDDSAFIQIVIDMFGKDSLVLKSNLEALLTSKNLCECTAYACSQLADDSPEYTVFGKDFGPRMSSFHSRIYATLLPDFITYESRVCAALCYFIREYCISQDIKLPKELQLGSLQGWGKTKKDKGRDASWNGNVFQRLDTMKKRPMRERTFANSNVLASWAVAEAIRKAKANKEGSAWLEGPYPIRKVEAALFMLGAELPPIE